MMKKIMVVVTGIMTVVMVGIIAIRKKNRKMYEV